MSYIIQNTTGVVSIFAFAMYQNSWKNNRTNNIFKTDQSRLIITCACIFFSNYNNIDKILNKHEISCKFLNFLMTEKSIELRKNLWKKLNNFSDRKITLSLKKVEINFIFNLQLIYLIRKKAILSLYLQK